MDKHIVLVNKDNPIKEEYIPKNLTVIGPNLFPLPINHSSDVVEMEVEAAINFNNMANELKKHFSSEIIPDSGYRSIEEQEEVLKYYLQPSQRGEDAYKTVAIPRTSEHHTGLAIDIALLKDGKYIEDITGYEEELKWLYNNCHNFGFILRYPKGKENITGYSYEPWHFRYVGKSVAKKIFEGNITLEEYHNILNQKL